MARDPFMIPEPVRSCGERLDALRALYHDVEIALVMDWLGLRRPSALASVDTRCEMPEDGLPPGPVRVILSEQSEGVQLSNAVARLALCEIEHRLPQWGYVTEHEVVLGRKPAAPREAPVALMPRFLFEINWANSGPGFSWPEAYHCTWFPGFARWVVTASQDSSDVHGYSEEAIGHFGRRADFRRGVARVVINWWRWQAEDWGKERWEHLFDVGQIDARTATTWADRVWYRASGAPRRRAGE